MRAVNLLPRDDGRAKRTKAQNAPLAVGLALALVVSVVVAAFFLTPSASVKDKQTALGPAQAELARPNVQLQRSALPRVGEQQIVNFATLAALAPPRAAS